MRILVAIPHFFANLDANATNRSHRPEARTERCRALIATVATLHQTFGNRVYALDHFDRVAWQVARPSPYELDIVICTAGDAHLLESLPGLRPLYRHQPTRAAPPLLGFECHRLMRDARGRYDYYVYLEDDIVVLDPLFFRKRVAFDETFGPDALLQPNRYEAAPGGPIQKLYVDYNLSPARTAPYQNVADQPRLESPFLGEDIVFERTNYPSAGCFVMNAEQVGKWADGPHFLDGDVSYLSPLDSAATLLIMRSFRIYKPCLDQASFLEVLHASPRWLPAVLPQVQLQPRANPFAPLQVEPTSVGDGGR